MLYAVVLPSTEYNELELNINKQGREEINSIISKKDCDKVLFKGFIEGKNITECKNKLIKLNAIHKLKYRLYGEPFTRRGNIIHIRRNDEHVRPRQCS